MLTKTKERGNNLKGIYHTVALHFFFQQDTQTALFFSVILFKS